MKRIKILGQFQKNTACDFIKSLPEDKKYVVEIKELRERRSTEQNSRLWAMLSDISRQVEWHGQHLSKDNWKDMFTAALKRQMVVPGIDGGFCVLGTSTREMTVAEMTELIDFMDAFGAQHGVVFNDPTQPMEG